MGTDAEAHSGVLVHYSAIVRMLSLEIDDKGIDIPDLCSQVLANKECREALEAYEVYLPIADAAGKEGRFTEFGTAAELLSRLKSRIAFGNWIARLFASVVGGESGKYSECWVEHEDVVKAIVKCVTKACGMQLPRYTLEAFGSARLTGLWNVKYGELYFVFSAEKCFKRVLTRAGKDLQSRLGEAIEVSEWVTISY